MRKRCVLFTNPNVILTSTATFSTVSSMIDQLNVLEGSATRFRFKSLQMGNEKPSFPIMAGRLGFYLAEFE